MADEFETMKALEDAVLSLEEEKRPRVLQWFWSRFANHMTGATGVRIAPPPTQTGADSKREYQTFAELFDASNPTVERDKALVAAYWVQVCLGQPSFPSQVLNMALKDLGHGIGNITEALTQLKEDRPALVLQLKKGGLTKQARKTYKLTQEGIRRVQEMSRASVDDGES